MRREISAVTLTGSTRHGRRYIGPMLDGKRKVEELSRTDQATLTFAHQNTPISHSTFNSTSINQQPYHTPGYL